MSYDTNSQINLADNLVRLRRERKMTQEELADFIGVTKASVSKWENRQSMPDILLLPQLAVFFDVTVDELLGYETSLSREQIRLIYQEMSSAFAKLPFRDAFDKLRAYTHRYYSCYPLLLQASLLYLNHFMLAEEAGEREAILTEGLMICDRILDNCTDLSICSDTTALKAMFELQLGRPDTVIAELEEAMNPFRFFHQSDATLISAYQLAGASQKAVEYAQISVYHHMLSLIGISIQMLALHISDLAACEETIRRVQGIIELYQVDALNPNSSAQFYYQTALVYAAAGKKQPALNALARYSRAIDNLFRGNTLQLLHGDDYFSSLENWIAKLPLGALPPRNEALVRQSALDILQHPLFESLRDTPEFQTIYQHLMKGGSNNA